MRVGWGFTPHCPFYSAGITYLGATQPHSLTRLRTHQIQSSDSGCLQPESPCVLTCACSLQQKIKNCSWTLRFRWPYALGPTHPPQSKMATQSAWSLICGSCGQCGQRVSSRIPSAVYTLTSKSVDNVDNLKTDCPHCPQVMHRLWITNPRGYELCTGFSLI